MLRPLQAITLVANTTCWPSARTAWKDDEIQNSTTSTIVLLITSLSIMAHRPTAERREHHQWSKLEFSHPGRWSQTPGLHCASFWQTCCTPAVPTVRTDNGVNGRQILQSPPFHCFLSGGQTSCGRPDGLMHHAGTVHPIVRLYYFVHAKLHHASDQVLPSPTACAAPPARTTQRTALPAPSRHHCRRPVLYFRLIKGNKK